MLAAFQVATQVGWGLKVSGPARGKQTLGLWQRDDTILFILTQNKIPRQARWDNEAKLVSNCSNCV